MGSFVRLSDQSLKKYETLARERKLTRNQAQRLVSHMNICLIFDRGDYKFWTRVWKLAHRLQLRYGVVDTISWQMAWVKKLDRQRRKEVEHV